MVTSVSLIVLLTVAYIAMGLRHVYSHVPPKELKRRASRDDHSAQALYRVAHHDVSSNAFLFGAAIIAATFAIIIASRSLNTFWASVFVGGLLMLLFTPLSNANSKLMNKLAKLVSPHLASLVDKISPFINSALSIIIWYRPHLRHTGVYEKEDLIDLIEKQKDAANNRIDKAELDIALHALSFGDKVVSDYMTPKRAIHFVERDEPVGPVLMSELHDSGLSRFPVRAGDDGKIVGLLYLRDLLHRTKSGIVANIMYPKVYYVGEQESLQQVLEAFIKTKHHLFIVVDEFEEVMGLITIEDVIEQVLGRKIVDEFDKYEDRRAVAQLQAQKDRAKHN